jgi:hypothetical protein
MRTLDPLPPDMERILAAAPFHSAVSLAATKAVHFSSDEIEISDFDSEDASAVLADDNADMSDDIDRDLAILELETEIGNWRRRSRIGRLALSPWLVYYALNKTFSQAPLFTRSMALNEQPTGERLSDFMASGLSAFNSFWAALASFEKGPLFGRRDSNSIITRPTP